MLGGAWHRPWTGCLIALTLVGVHVTRSLERSIEVRLIALATAVGAIVEMVQIATGTHRFTSGTVIDALAPAWLLTMWAQFATTFRHSLRTVISRPPRGVVRGDRGFLAGERLGAVTLLEPLMHGLLRLSISWALALVVFSAVAPPCGAGTRAVC